MKYRWWLFMYLAVLVVMVVVPLGTTVLSDTFVFELRLDYLVHAVVFAPVVVLWRLGFPGHSVWKIAGVGVLLAVGLEGMKAAKAGSDPSKLLFLFDITSILCVKTGLECTF